MTRILGLFILIPCLLDLVPFFARSESDLKFEGTGSGIAQEAFAHGMNSEFLPPASVEGRQLGLFVEMKPSYIYGGTGSNVSLQVKLFESGIDVIVTNVTYVIYVGRFNSSASQGADLLLVDMFYSQTGPLNLNIIPSRGETVEVSAPRSVYAEAWVANGENGKIDYRTPTVFGGGLYYIGVIIAGIDRPEGLLSPEIAPFFESGISIGYAIENSVQYHGQLNKVDVISFYDKIGNFHFEESNRTFSWSMPFDWEMDKIGEMNSIVVHQELRMPKVSGESYDNIIALYGTINGIKLENRNIALDPFSSEEYVTVHYILGKSDILDIGQNVPPGTPEMQFTLSPNTKNIAQPEETNKTRTVLMTEDGGIQVTIDWLSEALESGKDSEMMIRFYDAFAGTSIEADVIYDLLVRDRLGNQLLPRYNQTAAKATDIQRITFPSNDTFYFEINVRGIVLADDNNDANQQSSTLLTQAGRELQGQ